jgi:hypothetical protein
VNALLEGASRPFRMTWALLRFAFLPELRRLDEDPNW